MFRGPGQCDWCSKQSHCLEASHSFTKGIGGGGRMDVPENLTRLCRICHQSHHDGNHPNTHDLLALTAKRLGRSVADIEDCLWTLRRKTR